MAPSFDSIIVHHSNSNNNNNNIIELIQYKSSEYISKGISPNNKEILSEYNKISNEKHINFYNQLPNSQKILFIISNKPLMEYEKIKTFLDNEKYLQQNIDNILPKSVCIISHEVFEFYAGPFLDILYIPLSSSDNDYKKK
jgi:hypothetical protein